ncbi:PREDICTED: ATP-dependent RNA helicase vasa, isoform A-like [Papilio polytes]|uniref:ATP-dependent RNA helicase vasa, isoform A-like n=1 Tax=Papilio polytes TaxID=76194 RepID=UPI000675FA5A|nr:PREDICTED: ATP-dependent RNA helicase vasa, isoform A-like [Papilio polytes]
MDDEWDDSPAIVLPPPVANNGYCEDKVDEGHSLSRGRGFQSFNDNDYSKDTDNGFGERRGRGGGRGRGGRGGRGGTREPRNFDSNGDFNDEDRGERGDRGRGRGRGRGGGGRGGRHNDGGEDNEAGGDDEMKKPPVTYVPPEPTDNEQEMFSSTISSGINFDKFDRIAVKVSGENPPRPIESFESANLRKSVLENIARSGYRKPTPIQKHAIPIVTEGRDLMGCAQTGSGKTAAFLVPIINKILEEGAPLTVSPNAQPQVIIVSPTRELTLQIFNEARKFSYGSVVKVAVAYGGTAVRHQSDNISRGCHILVATLVATAVAARGLDIKNVDIVVNYDLPKSIDEYVHRIGRTGRVGNRGMAVSFFDADNDVALMADLAKILRQGGQPVPDFLQGGGTATYSGNKYGGSDVRNFGKAPSNIVQGQEPEEEW